MRLLTFVLLAGLLLLGPSVFAQNITFIKKDVSLVRLFKEIKKQTGINVIWNEGKFNAEAAIHVNFKNTPVDQVMSSVLHGTGFTFVITDKTIIINVKELSFTEKLMSLFKAIQVRGRVNGENNLPLSGAMVKLKEGKKYVYTDRDGRFSIDGVQPDDHLLVSYLGYDNKEVKAKSDLGTINLLMISSELNEVQVMSTGYQNIPKERATGAFVQIDQALLNRSLSTNILDRLDGVTSGLIFTAPTGQQMGQGSIEIHGRSTLFGNAEPLIVLDNFPYDGNLSNINPNDIESITVLKDAAAASAWGARSGNGVIVITTKKGTLNSVPKVGVNANVTIGSKPDLYYSPQLTSSEFIDVQKFLYDQGAYNTAIEDGYSALPPAVELFRNPSDPNYQSKLNALRGYDIRDQLSKYFYRPSISQQYQANVSGGTKNTKYFISTGYDKNSSIAVGTDNNRLSLNASQTSYFFKNKLEFFSNFTYTRTNTNLTNSYIFLNPYDQVADANGNPIVVANKLRLSYAETAGDGKLLNWLYKPLDELRNKYNTAKIGEDDYKLNLSLGYTILDGLKVSFLYNFEKEKSSRSTLNELQSFYTRDMINTFTQIDPITGVVSYPLPVGDIFERTSADMLSQNGRIQINEKKAWGKHSVNMIAGAEVREYKVDQNGNYFYGFNQETGTSLNSTMTFDKEYPVFYGSGMRKIPNPNRFGWIVNRFLSYYFNGSYSYNNKYIFSFSAREDESNLFGVTTNQKGVPLWSTGLAWIVDREHFFNADWLQSLKLRLTYGYTGNVDHNLSAYLTTYNDLISSNAYNQPYSKIINPPNPSLRWEKIKNVNFGIDFSLVNGRLSGSVDLWRKNGLDLIGKSQISPQTGISVYTGNSANTLTEGIDVQLKHVNLSGEVKWATTLLYNYSKNRVTDYKLSNGSNYNVVSTNYSNPLVGFPYFALFGFKYAGLNSTGDPQGYLNGELSTNYSAILNSTNREELVYVGSATPTSFGNLINTIDYKNFNLVFNVSYKLGYYFRRNSLNNLAVYSGVYQFSDYEKRWQKPGDENNTIVPALKYPGIIQRDNLYLYSDALIEHADHIRLKDIRLSYTFPGVHFKYFKNINVFTYANNLGIIWRANKYHLDPDYPTGIPLNKTIAFGVRADL